MGVRTTPGRPHQPDRRGGGLEVVSTPANQAAPEELSMVSLLQQRRVLILSVWVGGRKEN